MKRYPVNLLATLVLVTSLFTPVGAEGRASSSSDSYPRLVTGQRNPDCQLVLKAARLAFKSKSNHYSDAGDEVRSKDKSLVVWPHEENEVGSDSNFVDSPEAAPFKAIYVQKTPTGNARFVLRRTEFNWQGDNYDTLVVRSSDKDKLTELIHGSELKNQNIDVVSASTWQRPWLFRDATNNNFIAVDTQHPAEFMADWLVITIDKNGHAKLIGKIRFRKGSKDVAHEVPPGPLSEMRDLLDQIIGISKADEGTYHASTRVRLSAQASWGNLLYRPWAIDQPYNSRPAVDRGLKRWSKGSPVYKQQYNRLIRLYPEATVALTGYYQKQFNKSASQAKTLAASALDKVLRSHFMFPSDS